MTASRRAFLLRLLLSAIAFFLVARMVSGRTLLAELRQADPGPLLLAVVVSLGDRVMMAWKWLMLLRGIGIQRPLAEVIRVYFLGTFYGSFLPTGVGGDVIRIWQVAHNREEVGAATASVIMERSLGVIASALLVVGCLWFLVERARPDLLHLLIVVAIALGVAVLGLFWLLLGRMPARLERLVGVFRRYSAKPGLLGRFFGLTFIEQLFPVLAAYAVGQSLGFPVSLWEFLVIIPVTLFFARIPISIDGIGVVEGLYVFLFAHVGLGPTQSFLLALVGRAVTVFSVLPGVFFGKPPRPDGDPMPLERDATPAEDGGERTRLGAGEIAQPTADRGVGAGRTG